MTDIFAAQLVFGQIAEGQIEAWLRHTRRFNIVPVYDAVRDKKGPRLFTPNRALIAPDMLAIRGKDIRWIEAKHKSHFAWYRIGKTWTTGIDGYYFKQYLQLSEITQIPVWILFLHSRSDSPDGVCPTGLFGGDMVHLKSCIYLEYNAYGKGGMVYWRPVDLMLLASLSEVQSAAKVMGYKGE